MPAAVKDALERHEHDVIRLTNLFPRTAPDDDVFAAAQGTGALSGVHLGVTAEGDLGAPNPGCALSGTGTYNGQILFAP